MNNNPNEVSEIERLIRERTQELPPDMSRVIIEMVLMFIAEPGTKTLTLTKTDTDDKTHYSVELD